MNLAIAIVLTGGLVAAAIALTSHWQIATRTLDKYQASTGGESRAAAIRQVLTNVFQEEGIALISQPSMHPAIANILAASVVAISFVFSVNAASSQALMLFGGDSHKVFLGCMGCASLDTNSICNRYGKGSKYNSNSIFNTYRTFGSKYSNASPWNKYSNSNDVPVLVDAQGNFYGYFTINKFRSDAVTFAGKLNDIFEVADDNLDVVQNLICPKGN